LRGKGVRHGYVNLGGDIMAIGPQPDDSPWLIGIADPRVPGHLIATLPLSRGGLATSGDYERFFELDGKRYCHILNPRTGQPVQYWRSVSVLAPVCIAAGAYATTAMLQEAAAPALLQRKPVSCLAVGPQGELIQFNGAGRPPEGVHHGNV
jgi:thiamine biosynthesis lipoprotein